MPRDDYKTCKRCDRHASECGQLSHTRLCGECSIAVLTENVLGLVEHKGEPLARWRRGMAACIGVALLDDASNAA